jgi:hypothetical protein
MKTLARAHDKTEIIRRLKTVRPDSARRWGRMSAQQMVCHLSDSCRMALGEKHGSDATSLMSRTLVKWMALYLPLRWPPGIPTRPEIDQECAGTRPGEFAADVAALEALLDLMSTRDRDFIWPVHPFFGRMSRRAWLRWGYLHADHHLRQFGA